MNPDLEPIIKQTHHYLPFFIFKGKHCKNNLTIQSKDMSLGEISFQNQFFAQLCRPFGVINPLMTTPHKVEQV